MRPAGSRNTRRIAMLSIHSSPVGPLGRRDTGGMSVVVRRLASELGLRGHRVDIFTAASGPRPPDPEELSLNVRLIHLNGVRISTAVRAAGETGFAALEAFREREGGRYDLIHSHYWLSGEVGCRARERWGAPHLVTFHTLAVAKTRADGSLPEPAERLRSEARRVSDADRLLVPSAAERLILLRDYGAETDKIDLVPWGVDPIAFRSMGRRASRQRLGLPPSDRILLFVGRFDPMKGLDTLLVAMGRLPDAPPARLVIVGGDGEDAPETRRLKALAATTGAGNRVVFAGRQAPSRLPWYYSAADALVMPSLYESFGMVALEALACGTPLIAAPVGIVPSLIDGRRTGIRVEGASPDDLADAVRRFFDAPSPMGGGAARKTALAYRWADAADRLLASYDLALGRPVLAPTDPKQPG